MDINFTRIGKWIYFLTISILLFSFLIVSVSCMSQTVPKLKFSKPVLISGTDGQVGATYKFSNVSPNINAYVKIENIVNGAVLKNIDDSTLGYYDAWQPTVGGPGTYGASYIKWAISFDSANAPYTYSVLNASAIDVDGDNVRVREFINVNGQSTYNIPTQIPSLLTITNQKDTDNIMGTDPADSNLHVLGPVINRTGIDTLSQDVRVNFTFTNQTQFKIYTGSQVDSNGNSGAIATDRYHCIYFMNITGTYNVLPVKIESFNASLSKDQVNLFWTIDKNSQNVSFDIERSFDQNNFSSVGIVSNQQSMINGNNQFNYIDDISQIKNQDVFYYRVKMVSNDGAVSYSPIKSIMVNSDVNTIKAVVKVIPNPYMDQVNINFNSAENGKAEVRLTNLSGNLVKKIESPVSIGNNNIQLQNLSSQSAGIYMVSMVVNGKVISSQKIIKAL